MPEITYQQLTETELVHLAEQIKKRDEWRTVRDLIRKYYGPKATTVEIEVEAEYNDEGGYDDHITDVTVEDAKGEELEIDVTLPWFLEWLQYGLDKERAYRSNQKDVLACWLRGNQIDENLREMIVDEIECDEIKNGLDAVATTYDLTQEPPVSWPTVYVPVAAAPKPEPEPEPEETPKDRGQTIYYELNRLLSWEEKDND